MSNIFKKFTTDVLIIGGTNVLIALSGFIFLPLITKNLGPQAYGLWSQIGAVTGLFIGFVGLGLPYTLVRFLPAKTNPAEIREDFYSVLSVTFLSTLVISIAFIMVAGIIASYFFDGATDIVRITGLIIISMSANYAMMSYLRSFRMLKLYAVYSIIDTYGLIGIATLLILNGFGVLSLALAMLAVKTILTCVLFFVIKRRIGFVKPRFVRIKAFLKFGLSTVPGNICSWIVNASSMLVIATFLGTIAVGIYSAAYNVGNILNTISGIIGFVLIPSLAKLYDEKRIGEVKTLLSYTLKYILALSIPFLFGAAILATPVLELFSTPDIASEGQLVLILQSLNSVILVIGTIFGVVLFLQVRRYKVRTLPWIIAAGLNLLLNLVLVPRIGIIGSVISTMAAYSLLLIFRVYYSVKDFAFPIEWRFIIKSIIASGIMLLVIWWIDPQSNITTVLSIIAGIIIYGLILVLLKGFTKQEYNFVLSYIRVIFNIKKRSV